MKTKRKLIAHYVGQGGATKTVYTNETRSTKLAKMCPLGWKLVAITYSSEDSSNEKASKCS